MKKKILFDLVKYPEYGGISTVTSIVVPLLVKNGYEISIVSHRKPNKEYDGPTQVKIYYTPDPDNLNNKINWQFYNNLIKTGNFDLIIYQDSYAPIEKMVCNTAKRYNIDLYTFEHNSPCLARNSKKLKTWYSLKGIVRRLFHFYFKWKEIKRKKFLYAMSNKYILLCKSYIDEFRQYTNIEDNGKLLAINNPIVNINPTINYQKSNSMVFVGRLMPEKNVSEMIRMASNNKMRPYDFYIVGDGELRKNYEKLIIKNNLQNIHLEGFCNPFNYYNHCKVFWMCSKFEGWPMTLIEAMSYGCVPVVMKTFSAVNEIIDDGINGFIIDSNDEKDFLDKTISLFSNEKLFKTMSENAILKSMNYSIETILPKWIELIEEKS